MKPEINVVSSTPERVSNHTGYTNCTAKITTTQPLQTFEARATRTGEPRGAGMGLLVYSTGNVPVGELEYTFNLSQFTLIQGEYVVAQWGIAEDGVFDFGNVDFADVNFGDAGEWNDEVS